jgi:hypothetical protein
MAARQARDQSAFHLPELDWWQRHTIDVVVLVLGVSANLRVWLGFFSVRELPFAILVIVAAGCEIFRRIVDAGRSGTRPRLFTADRRFDLIAALFLMTGPDPFALPAAGLLSPSAWRRSLVLPKWLALGSGLMILAAVAASGIQRSREKPAPRIRELAGIPSLHIASIVVVADLRAA